MTFTAATVAAAAVVEQPVFPALWIPGRKGKCFLHGDDCKNPNMHLQACYNRSKKGCENPCHHFCATPEGLAPDDDGGIRIYCSKACMNGTDEIPAVVTQDDDEDDDDVEAPPAPPVVPPPPPALQPAAVGNMFDDPGWIFPYDWERQLYITELMSLKHGRADDPYPKETRFTKEDMKSVLPSDVKAYLLLKATGNPYADLSGDDPADPPIYARAESLRRFKSHVSSHMVNRAADWYDGIGGNPTKSQLVLDCIANVERLETQGRGSEANDKRPFTWEEYCRQLELLRAEQDYTYRIKYVAMTLFATHLIHRIDDSCKFKMDDPHGCVDHEGVLLTKTVWSKNVKRMGQCPDQYILAAMMWKYCTILNTSIYMEAQLGMYPNAKFLFTENDDAKKGPLNLKQNYRNHLKKNVWNDESFKDLWDETGDNADKGVGTHSIRKFASTKAKRRGARTNQVEYRGRWAGEDKKGVCGRRYIETKDTYTDAFVASELCEGGPIRYDVRPGVTITDDWTFRNVCPNIRRRFGNDDRLCRIMGRAILWAAFDDEASEFVYEADRIKSNFRAAHGYNSDLNPIVKTPLSILQIDDQLEIVPMEDANNGNNGNNGNAATTTTTTTTTNNNNDDAEWKSFIRREFQLLRQKNETLSKEVSHLRRDMNDNTTKLINNQRRYGGTIVSGMARSSREYQRRAKSHEAARQQQRRTNTTTTNNSTVAQRGAALQQRNQQQQQRNQHATNTNLGNRRQHQASTNPLMRNNTGPTRPRQQQEQQDPITDVDMFEDEPPVRVGAVPTRRGARANARIAKNVRDLFELWDEFMFGIGDNLPAKDLKDYEYKAFKGTYYRRLRIFKIQKYLVRHGLSVEAANHHIMQVYDQDKVTPLSEVIRISQKRRTNWPFIGDLRVDPRILVAEDRHSLFGRATATTGRR